jgi:EAL domain-containing protein (putative c-di-GMP-specific phosphodiesterase class I)
VRDLATNRDNQHLVRAIVGLARDFGYETIAEGVEDAETLALVKEYGVNFAQGFHLGRPTPIDHTNAHHIASELEESVRLALPEVADVVVHTKP